MRKQTNALMICLLIIVISGFRCHSSITDGKSEGTAYFWTNDSTVASHDLLIDGVVKGKIPYISKEEVGTGSLAVKQKGLAVVIKPGRYEVVVEEGLKLFCKGELRLRLSAGNTNISSSWDNGKCEVQVVIGN